MLERLARCDEDGSALVDACVESRSADHFRDLVRQACGDGMEVLGVCGGDGTVTLALEALDGPHVPPVGLLPVGSGNDFARAAGVPAEISSSLALLRHGNPRSVDVGRIEPGGKRFCCVVSVGLDEVALRIIHGSWLPRSKALNVQAAVRALCVYRPQSVRVTWQGGSFEGEAMFVAVTNTPSYGGGFQINPEARIDDGLLNLCIIRRTGRLRLLRQFPRILRGTHGVMPEVIQVAGASFKIESGGEPLPVAVDGDLTPLMTPVEVSCEPGRFSVMVSRGETANVCAVARDANPIGVAP